MMTKKEKSEAGKKERAPLVKGEIITMRLSYNQMMWLNGMAQRLHEATGERLSRSAIIHRMMEFGKDRFSRWLAAEEEVALERAAIRKARAEFKADRKGQKKRLKVLEAEVEAEEAAKETDRSA